MTLRLRGRTQFRDNSIGLEKLVTISSGKIVGRSSADSGEGSMKELSASEARVNLSLNTDSTNVGFGDISSTDIDMSGQTLTLTGLTTGDSTLILSDDSISGDKIHGGDIGGGYGSVSFTEEYTYESFDHYNDSDFDYGNYARYYGRDISLSNDNNVLIVSGNTYNYGTNINPNVFRYEYNSSTNEWDKADSIVVTDLVQRYENMDAGNSVSTNSDGSILVYGHGNYRDYSSNNRGRMGSVYILYWDSTDNEYKNWNYLDTSLEDLSTDAGGVRYVYDLNSWNYGTQSSNSNTGVFGSNNSTTYGHPRWFGRSVSINGDGDKLIVSSYGKSDVLSSNYSIHSFGQVAGYGYIQTFFWVDRGGSAVGTIDSVSDTTGLNYPDTLAVDSTPTYDDTGYHEFQHIRVSAPSSSKGFGFSCSMSNNGSKMVVGAPFTTVDSKADAGVVYTYDWNSTNKEWDIRTQVLQLDSPSADDQFGVSVDISGDGQRLFVGQSGYWFSVSGHENTQQGAVYVYDLNDSGNWELNESLTDSNGSSSDNFGLGLASNSSGTQVFVGTPGKDNTSYTSVQDIEGSIYEYETDSSDSAMLSFSGSQVTISNALVHSGTSHSTLKSSNVDINGGVIDDTAIGSESATEGTFTDLIAVGTGSSSLNNVVIGNNTASSGGFTTLTASTSLNIGSSNELSISNSGVLSSSGTISSTSESGTNSFSGNVTIGGNLTVEGTTTTVDTENLVVEDTLAKFGDGNSGDAKDLGFYSEYVNNSSETKYAGLFRDASDGEFKLFNDFGTEPSENVVGDISSSLGTLNANIKGDVTGDLIGNADTFSEFETTRSFSVSGDVSTSMSHNFNGTQSVNLEVSLNNSVLDFANMHGDAVVTSAEGLDNFESSDVMFVTAAAIVDYVEDNLLRGGSSVTMETSSIKMLDSNDEFVRVKKHFQKTIIDADDVINEYVSISTDLEADFSGLAEVFLNGQKIASGTSAQVAAGTKDYYFDTSSSNNHKIYMDPDFIKSGDKLEIIYYILAT